MGVAGREPPEVEGGMEGWPGSCQPADAAAPGPPPASERAWWNSRIWFEEERGSTRKEHCKRKSTEGSSARWLEALGEVDAPSYCICKQAHASNPGSLPLCQGSPSPFARARLPPLPGLAFGVEAEGVSRPAALPGSLQQEQQVAQPSATVPHISGNRSATESSLHGIGGAARACSRRGLGEQPWRGSEAEPRAGQAHIICCASSATSWSMAGPGATRER